MYQTQCVNCQSSLSFEARDAGELIQCQKCGQYFALPDKAGTVATMNGELRQLSAEISADKVVASETSFRWKLPTMTLVLLLGLALAAVIFGNLATKILVPVLVLSAINGYRLGAARVVSTVAALILATISAVPLGRLCEDTFAAALGTTGVINRLAAVSIAAIVVLFASGALLMWLAGWFIKRRPAWRPADRWSGSVLGVAQGGLVVCLVIWGVLVLDSAARGRLAAEPQSGRESINAQGIVQLADSVRGSMFGPLAEKYNPLGEMKAFSMPSKFLKVVNHPQALAAFVEHPAVTQIKERPTVAIAMKTLQQDPHVKKLIASGKQMSGADLAAILSSPATLKLVDESDLIQELRPIAAEVEMALDDAVAVAEANPGGVGVVGIIPEGAVSYQIHPAIQPWELTAIPVKVQQPQATHGEQSPKMAAIQEKPQRTRERRTSSVDSNLTGFEGATREN